jgi:hypothetical protein
VGTESPSEEHVWLIDRLTGSVFRCEASEHGKAVCDADVTTGSIGERGKRRAPVFHVQVLAMPRMLTIFSASSGMRIRLHSPDVPR